MSAQHSLQVGPKKVLRKSQLPNKRIRKDHAANKCKIGY